MKRKPLIHGVGVSDADYAVTRGETVGGRWVRIWTCPIYMAWAHMLKRCYCSKFHRRNPTYRGCSVTPEWHSFTAFRAWALTQDHEGKQLDKDILLPGNKVYSPETCVFVPASLNLFLCDSGAARGSWPLGVSLEKQTGKFKAYCGNPFTGKCETIGRFSDPDSAHLAWRARKSGFAAQLANSQRDGRIARALVSRYPMSSAVDASPQG